VGPLDGLADDLVKDRYAFTWITPDLCHDMHDCEVTDGDNWLATTVPLILDSPGWRHGGVLYVTFDEDNESGATDNLVPLLVVSPRLQAHSTAVRYDHYSLLAAIEDGLRLSRLGQAASAAPISGLLS
jgi:acid phosphatase